MTKDYFPPASFYFDVNISGFTGEKDTAFQEVSGLEMKLDVEEIIDGGENRFVHKIPGKTRYPNLVLKRGFMVEDSELGRWCKETFEGDLQEAIKTRDIEIRLLDEQMNVLSSWTLVNAWPVKWAISQFNAQQNAFSVESLEFAYQYFTRS